MTGKWEPEGGPRGGGGGARPATIGRGGRGRVEGGRRFESPRARRGAPVAAAVGRASLRAQSRRPP